MPWGGRCEYGRAGSALKMFIAQFDTWLVITAKEPVLLALFFHPIPSTATQVPCCFLSLAGEWGSNLLCSEINSPGAYSLAFGSLLTSHFSHLAPHTYTFLVVPAYPLLAIPICLPIWHAVDFGDSLVYCQHLSDNAMGFISLLPSLMCLQDLSFVGRRCVSVVHGGVSVPRTVPGT